MKQTHLFLSGESFYEPVSIQMLVDDSFRMPENWRLKKLRKEDGGLHRFYCLLNFMKEDGVSSYSNATKDH